MTSVSDWCIHVSTSREQAPIVSDKNPTAHDLLHRVSQSPGSCADIRSGALVTRMATYRRARTFRHAMPECFNRREKLQYLQTWRWSVVPNESSRDFGPCDRFWTQLALRCFLLPTSPPGTALRERYVGP